MLAVLRKPPPGPVPVETDTNPFRRALAGWDKDHWVKKSMRTPTSKGTAFCALGRLIEVTGMDRGSTMMREIELAGRHALRNEGFGQWPSLICFNDANRTTFPMLVKVFERAAKIWDEMPHLPELPGRRRLTQRTPTLQPPIPPMMDLPTLDFSADAIKVFFSMPVLPKKELVSA